MSTVLTAQDPSAKYLVQMQPPLMRHFDLIAQAPGGVARLRELILTLAVQGKLVSQDLSDEPASELLKKIRAEKDRLIAEGKIKRDKTLAEIGDNEKPFQLPARWSWEPLGSLGNIFSGNSINAAEKEAKFAGVAGLPFIATKDVGYGLERLDYENGIRIPLSEHGLKVAHAGAVLMCAEGGSAGKKCGLADQDICFGNKLFANEPYAGISSKFILFVYLAPYFFDSFKSSMTGIIGGISLAKFLELPIPLPPLAEQSRIVTRVEELMQLCDALEASGQLEAQQHAQLVSTLLGTLTQSETPEALADNWQRIATHFDVLLDRPEAVDALEQTILQLAVRGLLVPQDPTDEPASALLQKIRTEKDHLIAQGQIKRDKPLPSVANDEVLFELPLSWEWTRLGNFCKVISGYAFSSADLSCESGIRAIKITNAGVGEFYETDDYLPISFAIGFENFKAEKDDLILALTRPYIASGLKISRCPPSYEGALINQRVAAIRPASAISSDFVFAYMCSKDVLNIYQNRFNGSGLQPNLKVSDVTELLMPLPPLSEQSRIVTRVNELRSLCADLRQRLTAGQTTQKHLADALVTA